MGAVEWWLHAAVVWWLGAVEVEGEVYGQREGLRELREQRERERTVGETVGCNKKIISNIQNFNYENKMCVVWAGCIDTINNKLSFKLKLIFDKEKWIFKICLKQLKGCNTQGLVCYM